MYVIINGVNSDTIRGLQILSLPPITKPKMRTSVATIDGRPGDIVTYLGYEAYNKTIKILLHDTYDLPAIMAYFNQSGTIIFSNDPDKIYTFETIDQINYERAVKFKTASVTIHVQPYKTSASEQPATGESESFMDSEPYLFRQAPDGANMEIDELAGGSVVFNQLCNAASVTVANGHKYFMKKGTAYSLGASTGTAITGLTSGSDMVIDLTLMFGSTVADYIYSLETATAGAGVAWCKAYNPKMFSTYQPYNEGTLMSVNTSAHKMVGKNLLEPLSYSDGVNVSAYRVFRVSLPKDARLCMSFKDKDTSVDVSSVNVGFVSSNYTSGALSSDQYRWIMAHEVVQAEKRNIPISGNESIYLNAILFYPRTQEAFDAIMARYDIQIEYGSTATAYEPYTEVVYSLSCRPPRHPEDRRRQAQIRWGCIQGRRNGGEKVRISSISER